jgi:hypothetical protein
MSEARAEYAALLEAKSHWQRDAKAVLAVAAAAKDAKMAPSPPKRGGPVGKEEVQRQGEGMASEEMQEMGWKIQRQTADVAAAQLSLAEAEGKVRRGLGRDFL